MKEEPIKLLSVQESHEKNAVPFLNGNTMTAKLLHRRQNTCGIFIVIDYGGKHLLATHDSKGI